MVRSFEYGAWSARYVPTMSLLAYSFFNGLIFLYIFDLYFVIAFALWYYMSRAGYHSFITDVVLSDFWWHIAVFCMLGITFILTYTFLLFRGKYKKYYQEFEKLSQDMKSTWSGIAILLFIMGILAIWILGRFRGMYIPQ